MGANNLRLLPEQVEDATLSTRPKEIHKSWEQSRHPHTPTASQPRTLPPLHRLILIVTGPVKSISPAQICICTSRYRQHLTHTWVTGHRLTPLVLMQQIV